MSRHVVAGEIQQALEQIQKAAQQAEQLARSSSLVDPKWFRGMQTMVAMAAGELEQKGLLQKRELAKADAS